MKSIFLKTAVTAVLMGMTAVAFGAPPPDKGGGGSSGGGPPDGKGNKPDTEVGFNLSVPAIIAGGPSGFAINCDTEGFTELVPPNKDPVYYPYACADTHDGAVCVDEGNYYVQRDAAWQAPCFQTDAVPVSAEGHWGDNLGGDAMLKVGSPIRVEIVLWDSVDLASGQQGYQVIKLEPAELDRVSDYGHLAGGSEGSWEDAPADVGAIVHDPDATLTIEKIVDGTPVSTVYNGEAGAEINATGKIVYGHNLRVIEAGWYRITYTLPNVSLTGCDLGDCANDATKAVLEIEVIPGGGGGGKKK